MADVTLFRENFYKEVFEPYNQAVKNGKYNKIPYSVWRTIRDWCCDHQWAGYYVGITAVSCGYHIMLEHNDRICPEIATVAFNRGPEGPAFAEYLRDHMKDLEVYDNRKLLNSLSKAATTVTTASATFNLGLQAIEEAFCTHDTKTNQLNANDGWIAIGENGFEPNSIYLTEDSIYINGKSIPQYLDDMGVVIKEKENNNMKFGNFDFGPVDSSVRMSLYGMAIKNASGTYVAYDAKSKQVMDVDIFNFDGANKFIYKMPVAIKDVKVSDVVIHARKPMFVLEVRKDNRLNVLDIFDGEEKTIVLPRSMFGFDFITKVVSLVDFSGGANAANPFGNMLPLLLMSDNKGSDDLLPLLLMSQNNSAFASNPLMMYALMSKDGKANDMLPWLLMCGSPVLPIGEDTK